MKVLKFGGSSVAKPERIQAIGKILQSYYERGENFAVVVSAFGGVTDQLIEMSRLASAGDEAYESVFAVFRQRHKQCAEQLLTGSSLNTVLEAQEENHAELKNLLYGIFLLREASDRTLDYLLSFGERNSAYLISFVLSEMGIRSEYLDARKILVTDDRFGSAKVDFDTSFPKIQVYFNEHPSVQVVTGFIASAPSGQTTTLGRGGSDYTVSIIGAALSVERIEIWTDVNGVLTADPRKVRKAFTIPSLTYEEAMEMSHFGAKVIYPPTLLPAMSKSIPVFIRNTFEPEFPGSEISDRVDQEGRPVKGISSINNISLLTLSGSGLFGVPGIAARLFGALAQSGINIILITQGSSEHSISFAVSPHDAERAREVVEDAFAFEMNAGRVDNVKVEDDLSIIAVIGENMRYQPGISGRLFDALGRNGVNAIAIAQGSSERNISVVIPTRDEQKGLNALHDAFFLSDTKEIHLFLVGVGLIGSTLIEQIKRQAEFLRTKQGMEVRVIGLANSKQMVFEEEGIDLVRWREDLVEKGVAMKMPSFIQQMKELNMSNTIFVDNTAHQEVAQYYADILDSSISISTPNKIATSSTYLEYQRLKRIAEKRGVPFLYETNVGAGLPVLSTLNDLILSGDEILKIEGVLSGSLSFIFNSFDGSEPFSKVVRKAQELGYTEPDPRIDLVGLDVCRKLVILAREAGLDLEPGDVELPGVLPDHVMEAKDVQTFFSELERADLTFTELYQSAAAEGKVLRMVAKLEDRKATIELAEIGMDHPFYSLSGSDNMIVFTTSRYKDRPLVVRGPGAGADVTAAGVFAEIIRIANYLS